MTDLEKIQDQLNLALNEIKTTLTVEQGELIHDYVFEAQRIVKKLNTPDVVGRSEQFICPCCGSDKTYKTDAIYCSRCAVTTEI